jgi:hypothetical protein
VTDFYVAAVLALFFLVGLFVRFTDVFERNKRYAHFTLVSGFAYGFGGGVLAALSPQLAAGVFGVVIGVLAAGKVDSRQHQLAVGVLFLTALLLNAAPLFVPLACFALASFLDEDLHELVTASRKKLKRSLLPEVFSMRILVEAAAAGVWVWTGQWIYFACALAFDAGCYAAPKLLKDFPEH